MRRILYYNSHITTQNKCLLKKLVEDSLTSIDHSDIQNKTLRQVPGTLAPCHAMKLIRQGTNAIGMCVCDRTIDTIGP